MSPHPPAGALVLGSGDPHDLARLNSVAIYLSAVAAGDPRLAALTRAATVMLRMPMAWITLVDRDRQVVLASTGDVPDAERVGRDLTFCREAFRSSDRRLLVRDTTADGRFAASALAGATPAIRCYAGVVLQGREGWPLGTLCVLDVRPRALGAAEIETLAQLAEVATGILELRRWEAERAEAPPHPAPPRATDYACGPDGRIRRLDARRNGTAHSAPEPDIAVGHEWVGLVHPLQQDDVRARWAQAACGLAPFEEQFRAHDREGCARWMQVSLLPAIHDGDTEWRGSFRLVDQLDDALSVRPDPATHDVLTGLVNRHRFQLLLDRATRDARRGIPLALLYLDLDDFKLVNDSLGHETGDGVLREVARRLVASVRRTDIVCRLGGDEFLVVQLGVDSAADVIELASRIIEAVEMPMSIETEPIDIGVSIGAALAPRDGASGALLLRNADLALYCAKQDGRGTMRMFCPTMDNAVHHQREIRRGLGRAVGRRELFLEYQPILSLPEQRVATLEALLRWRHPQRGIVSPAEFVPVAEQSGLIVPIGAWVLAQACRDAMRWAPEIRVAVNLSPRQFATGDLVGAVLHALETSGLAPDRLELEITETLPLLTDEGNLSTLRALRQLGVQVVLDDFGTGYSSLSYLGRFHFDRLKLDRSMIAAMGRRDGLLIARSIIRLATELGIEVTAEGIEAADQLRQVTAEGCRQAQGFHIARPVTPRRLAATLPRIASRLGPAARPDEALAG